MSNSVRKVMNAVMKPLLRSPFHFLVSSWCMLITVTGRKTGKQYTTPVYYRCEGNIFRFFSGRNLRWVKNLDGGARVTVRLRGKDISATAAPCTDAGTNQRVIALFYPRMSAVEAAELVLIEVRV
jgi:deazaflavin-dependent oxidoreductase (nitroreductase family)